MSVSDFPTANYAALQSPETAVNGSIQATRQTRRLKKILKQQVRELNLRPTPGPTTCWDAITERQAALLRAGDLAFGIPVGDALRVLDSP
jgi:hypothetical protein